MILFSSLFKNGFEYKSLSIFRENNYTENHSIPVDWYAYSTPDVKYKCLEPHAIPSCVTLNDQDQRLYSTCKNAFNLSFSQLCTWWYDYDNVLFCQKAFHPWLPLLLYYITLHFPLAHILPRSPSFGDMQMHGVKTLNIQALQFMHALLHTLQLWPCDITFCKLPGM